MLIAIQVKLLQRLFRLPKGGETAYETRTKVVRFLGETFLQSIAGKTVIDFGCGEGDGAVELARGGAKRVIGIDIREEALRAARQKAAASGVDHVCSFMQQTQEHADVIISLDAFEHFAEPAAVLQMMSTLLKAEGEVVASFGPTWYHPLGGHSFSFLPWAHLIFSEEALIGWRSGFKSDGATRFREVPGGLNQISIRKFERIVAGSPFQFASLEAVPIRKLRWFHNRFTREFTSAVVRCRLVKREVPTKSRATA
ncbi:MAG TPA: methyltransferase domain-containing protein [Bryobacteraceae bacterium]|nr:methyltransferase domain-containing protein [Bryobacteraceae bacterium]